jgi:hypothetical protein
MCLEKNPAARYSSAGEVREALKTIMKAMQLETGGIPGDAAANLVTTGPESEKRSTSFLSMLAERFRESSSDTPQQNSLVVLPFNNLGTTEVAPLYGFALADAIAARLARIPSIVVRPSSSLMTCPHRRWTRWTSASAAGLARARRQFHALRTRLRPQLATARCRRAKRSLRRHHQRRFL